MKKVDLSKLDKDELSLLTDLVGNIQKEGKVMQREVQKRASRDWNPNPGKVKAAQDAPSFVLVSGDVPVDYLFIDDQLTPGEATESFGLPPDKKWRCLKTYSDFEEYLHKHGIPKFISFDFMLGIDKTGLDCAKLLVKYCLENNIDKLPECRCHSALQSGRQAIESYLMFYGKHKRVYKEKIEKEKKI